MTEERAVHPIGVYIFLYLCRPLLAKAMVKFFVESNERGGRDLGLSPRARAGVVPTERLFDLVDGEHAVYQLPTT